MSRTSIELLEPGRVFVYRGPRKWPLGRRGLAVGKVIGIEARHGIAHVRTYISGSDGQTPQVFIGHIPMLVSDLAESVVEFRDRAPVEEECWHTINAWRNRHSAGEVGAFRGALWKAEQIARDCLPEEVREKPIAHAFPKTPAGGQDLTSVEVLLLD